MKRFLVLLALLPLVALGQTVPNGTITQGQIWTPAQWNAAWGAKQDLTFQTAGEIAAGVTPCSLFYLPGNVLRYCADPTGVADSTSAIQNAINSLPLTGAVVFLPNGSYKIGALTMGNGSTSAVSTRMGMTLQGESKPLPIFQTGYPNTGSVVLKYTGTTGDVLTVLGPLSGWAMNNIVINGNGTSGNCLHITSASHSFNYSNILFNCKGGLLSDTIASNGTGANNVDAGDNNFIDLFIRNNFTNTPAGAYAVKLTSGGVGNSDYDHFFDLTIAFASPVATTYGLWLAASDNSRFYGVHMSGATAAVTTLYLDYSVNAGWPADSVIMDVDFGGAAGVIANNGVPSGATPNKVIAVSSTNGVTANPNLANLLWDVLPALAGTSGSIGGGSIANGACTTGTVAITGVTTGMTAAATPAGGTQPGAGFTWDAYVSAAGTATVRVCNATGASNTPTATTYNVRVLQ